MNKPLKICFLIWLILLSVYIITKDKNKELLSYYVDQVEPEPEHEVKNEDEYKFEYEVKYEEGMYSGESGRLSNFRVETNDTDSIGFSNVFTLRKNGVETSLSCTISDGYHECSDSVNTLNVSSDDVIEIISKRVE